MNGKCMDKDVDDKVDRLWKKEDNTDEKRIK